VIRSPIQDHPLQLKIWKDPARFKTIVAGRRLGKTFLCREKLLSLTENHKHEYLYVAPTRQQAKDLVWETLKDRFRQVGWAIDKNESELTITRVRTKTKIYVRGAEAFDRFRGLGLNGAFLDEYADMSPEVWAKVIRAALADKRGFAWFLGTPKGYNHFFDLYQSSKNKEDWSAFQFKTIQSPFFSTPEGLREIEQARAELDEKTFRQEFEASFESFTGRIYYAFDRAKHVKTRETHGPIHVGMDFNVNPFTFIFFRMTNNHMHIFDEGWIRNTNTDEVARHIKQRYPDCRDVVPDYSGIGKRTSSVGKTDHSILKEHGFIVNAVVNPHRVDRYNLVNRNLEKEKITIDPKCVHTIDDLEKCCFKEGISEIDTSDPDRGHITDALGYPVYRYFNDLRRVSTSY